MQDQEACVNDGLSHQRNIVEHVLGLVDAGGGIDIATKGGTYALEPVENALPREVLCSIETHVLKEMSETILIWGFLDSAHICGQVELCPLGGLVIVADVIGQAVVERSLTNRRIVRKLLGTSHV